MKTWYEIYTEEIKAAKGIKPYIDDKIKRKKLLIKMITEKVPNGAKILEAGCGTGIISTYLSKQGYNVTGIDIDEGIIKLAQSISKDYAGERCAKFIKQSILELDNIKQEYDVSFSSGVLEHFEDDEIISSLKGQLSIAKYVVFAIPTLYFEQSEAMHGDERFMSIRKWRELIYASGGKILKEGNCHFLKFPYHYLNYRKLFKPWPYRIFMITKR